MSEGKENFYSNGSIEMKIYEGKMSDQELETFVDSLRMQEPDGYVPLSSLFAEHIETDCAECLDMLMRVYAHRECLTGIRWP